MAGSRPGCCGVPSLVSAVSGLGSVFVDADKKAALVRSIVHGLYGLALAHRNSCAIFQNPEDRDQMVNAKLAALERTVLIRGSGVDTTMFHPSPEPAGVPVAILPARLLWYKGIREFVEADAPFASARGRDPDGPGRRAADAQSARASPRPRSGPGSSRAIIEWWGYRSDMPQVYADCHIVCLPSFYGEGVPRALIEAAACARPIVTTDTPGCREVVHDGDNGLLVPPRSPAALVRRVAHPRRRSRPPARDGLPGPQAGDGRILARSRGGGDPRRVRAAFGYRRKPLGRPRFGGSGLAAAAVWPRIGPRPTGAARPLLRSPIRGSLTLPC